MIFLLLLIILFIELGGGGLINPHTTFALSTGIGKFQIGQILLIFLYGIFIVKFRHGRIDRKHPLIISISLIYILIFFELLRGGIEGVSLRTMLHGITIIKMIFFIFPLIMFIKDSNMFNKLINVLIIIGIISVFISIFQFITGISLSRSIVRHYGYGFYRVYHPGALLMSFCLLLSQANLLFKTNTNRLNLNFIYLGLFTLGLLTTLHRSLIGSVLIVSFIMLFFFIFISKDARTFSNTIIYSIIIIAIIIISGYLFLHKSGFGLDIFYKRMMSSVQEVEYFSGNYKVRWDIFKNSYNAVMQLNPIFGKGLDVIHIDSSPFRMTYDNTYANIFILFGFIGYFLFGLLIINSSKTSLKIIHNGRNKNYRALSLSIFAFNILILIFSVFSANIIYSPHLSVIITTISLLYLMEYFENVQAKGYTI